MSTPEHEPDKLSTDLTSFLKSADRLKKATITGLGVLGAIAIGVLIIIVLIQQAEIRSNCDFYRPLTPLAPTIAKPATKPSKVGVQILFGARVAYGGLGCGSPLPPAAPGLSQWVKYYRITP